MAGLANNQQLRETVDAYIAVAFGDPPEEGINRAAKLAEENIHSAILRSLQRFGSVRISTDSDVQDTSCFYEISSPDDGVLAVYISTVLPYAVVLWIPNDTTIRYITAEDSGWPGVVARAVTDHGVTILPGELCIAPSLIRFSDERTYSYFELLFSSVIDAPDVE